MAKQNNKAKETKDVFEAIATRFRGRNGANRYAWTRRDVLKAIEAGYDLGVNSEKLLNAIFSPESAK